MDEQKHAELMLVLGRIADALEKHNAIRDITIEGGTLSPGALEELSKRWKDFSSGEVIVTESKPPTIIERPQINLTFPAPTVSDTLQYDSWARACKDVVREAKSTL